MARPISKMTKFILSLPRTLPAKEVLSRAKAGGMKMTESNVHRVRRLHRTSGSSPVASPRVSLPAGGSRKSAAAAVTRAKTHTPRASVEDLLRAVAAELGLGQALEVLRAERARVNRILGTGP